MAERFSRSLGVTNPKFPHTTTRYYHLGLAASCKGAPRVGEEYKVAPKEAKSYPPGANIKGRPTLHTTTLHLDKPDVTDNTRIYVRTINYVQVHGTRYRTNTQVANSNYTEPWLPK